MRGELPEDSLRAEMGSDEEESELEDLSMDWHLEAVRKGAQRSYKHEGKKERQAEMFPALQAEIERKRKDLYEPLVWGTPEARSSEAFKDALWKASEGLIGGTPEEKAFLQEGFSEMASVFLD